MTEYQPKTGQRCSCRKGQQRDNCPNCEGTGMVIDFAAIRARNTSRQRFAITHLTADGLRTLTFPNQGRNHYDTREAAQTALDAYVANGSLRAKVLGDMVGTLEVRPVECYAHGDARTIYFPTNMQPVTGPPFTATCVQCGKRQCAGGDPSIPFSRPDTRMYADTEGTPFKAYYCAKCAAPALQLQKITQEVR